MWHNNEMIYPTSSTVQLPNPDMPKDIQKDYLEVYKYFQYII